jgi:hypothetical protein
MYSLLEKLNAFRQMCFYWSVDVFVAELDHTMSLVREWLWTVLTVDCLPDEQTSSPPGRQSTAKESTVSFRAAALCGGRTI